MAIKNLILLEAVFVAWGFAAYQASAATPLQLPKHVKYARLSPERLLNLMFSDPVDAVRYQANCGRAWHKLIAEWEPVQGRAINQDNVKAVVWRCQGICGGLGDRLRGIMTSFMLALVTKRGFFIDSDTPVPLHKYFHLANPTLHWKFDLALTTNKSVLEETNDAFPSIGEYASADLSRYEGYDVLIQSNNFWQPLRILQNPGLNSLRALRLYEEQTLAGCLLNYLLVPSNKLRQELAMMRSKLMTNDSEILAVQVRTGDSQHKNFTVLDALLDRFQMCVQGIQSSSDKKYRLFLTTDSEVFAEKFAVLNSDVLSFPGQVFHVDGDFGTPNSVHDAFTKVLLDHIMLSQAHQLIISRSGFAELAAVRGFKAYYTPLNCHTGQSTYYKFPELAPIGTATNTINSLEELLLNFNQVA